MIVGAIIVLLLVAAGYMLIKDQSQSQLPVIEQSVEEITSEDENVMMEGDEKMDSEDLMMNKDEDKMDDGDKMMESDAMEKEVQKQGDN